MTCKDCPDRTVGCHINCEIYKADRAANEAVKAKRKSEKLKYNIEVEHGLRIHKSVKRIEKRRRGY